MVAVHDVSQKRKKNPPLIILVLGIIRGYLYPYLQKPLLTLTGMGFLWVELTVLGE